MHEVMFFLFVGFPHIHGVAWIPHSWFIKNGFKDGILSEADDQAVCKLADKLISCQIPEPGPEPHEDAPVDEKHQHAKDKMLKKLFQKSKSITIQIYAKNTTAHVDITSPNFLARRLFWPNPKS